MRRPASTTRLIEPIAELFNDLDGSIDSRADDHEKKEADDGFTGFHRIEYGLFEKKSTDGLAPLADKLNKDVAELQSRIKTLTIPPEKMVGGAAALIEEVGKTKITGEEDRYSHTDLYDFQANVDGAKKIVDLLRPLTMKADAETDRQTSTGISRRSTRSSPNTRAARASRATTRSRKKTAPRSRARHRAGRRPLQAARHAGTQLIRFGPGYEALGGLRGRLEPPGTV